MENEMKLDSRFIYDTIGLLYSPDLFHVRPDEIRDALSKGQLTSKIWLAKKISIYCDKKDILIVGGWIGTLTNIINQANYVHRITSSDINPVCERAALHINRDAHNFTAITADMYLMDYTKYEKRLIINTSCEHIPNVRAWLDKLPANTLVCLQSNNMFGVADHINCCNNIEEFKDKAMLKEILYEGQIITNEYVSPPHQRFMLIGIA